MTLIAFPSVSSLLSLKNRPSWFIRWMWLLWQTSSSARYQKCFVSVDFLSCTMKAFNNLTAHMFCLLWIWKSSSRTSLWWFNDLAAHMLETCEFLGCLAGLFYQMLMATHHVKINFWRKSENSNQSHRILNEEHRYEVGFLQPLDIFQKTAYLISPPFCD